MGALAETLRVLDARARTVKEHGTPAIRARDERTCVIVVAVTHDFEAGWRPHVRSLDPYRRRFPLRDLARCRFCGRREDHVVHDSLEFYVSTLTASVR